MIGARKFTLPQRTHRQAHPVGLCCKSPLRHPEFDRGPVLATQTIRKTRPLGRKNEDQPFSDLPCRQFTTVDNACG